MTKVFALLLAGAATLSFAAPALADAATAFRDGKWSTAMAQGRDEATPAGLVLAGRSQLAVAAYETRDKAQALAQVERAEADFDAALAKNPKDRAAQMQKAVAIGYRAKLTKSPGLGKDARKRFETVRDANPDYALAWSAVGGWHAGAIATLGNFMAGTVLGAKPAEIERNFGQALKLDPNNPSLRAIYAMSLLDIDRDNAPKAATILNGIGRLPANDGFDALLRAQGVQLAAALKAGDTKAAQALARRLQAFGTIG
jgi:tetratricopeptide (TPR) repeat protein